MMMPTGLPSSRMSGALNFELASEPPTRNRSPHSPALPVALATPDIVIPYPAPLIVFHTGDQTMTYELECQIEELRAELRNAVYKDEREWIPEELASAERQLNEEEAPYDAMVLAEPPE
jgi:hypothetical protein